MKIGDLYGKAEGQTVYIVGTGPSMRMTPLDFFRDKITIGLNQCWRYIPTSFSITVHPELLPDYEAAAKSAAFVNRTRWIVKKKAPRENLSLDDPNYFVFHTSPEISTITTRPKNTLYLGEGAQTVAMDMAARMGAKFIILVGCDCKALRGDFHGHNQHVRWLGLRPDQQYLLYRKRTAAVRAALRPLGVSVMTMSPFIGVDAGEEDYSRLCHELKLKPLPIPKDTSPYTRKMPPK